MTRQPLWVIFCRLPEKGRKEKEESRGDEREGKGRKRNRNENEKTEEIKTFPPLYPYLLQGLQALPNRKPISVGCPSDLSYTTPLHHPTTPICPKKTVEVARHKQYYKVMMDKWTHGRT